jgi:hypothetical protein
VAGEAEKPESIMSPPVKRSKLTVPPAGT